MSEVSNDSVQVIDEAKEFQRDSVKAYLSKVSPNDMGLDYHVISVFGSQSTGKSTLLNALFHTKFDVMNEAQRQQTTKGIWLGFSPKVESHSTSLGKEHVFVMDVEGSDGRERGEDQDFERKAALFALATSEVLIVNIWEHQVGLYQGANMGLLKTVFEVNLSLFGDKDHKMLLLFVIRDHVGSTPLENLSNTLTQDLHKMWNDIAKPSTVASDTPLSKYFDLEFVGLSHKVLQEHQFHEDVRSLGDRFTPGDENYLFKKDYHQAFPIDGWSVYAENCWNQIQSNKDLDLPTQQILVARFRCDEIIKETLELFDSEFEHTFGGVKLDGLKGASLADEFKKLLQLSLSTYDLQAGHYNKEVYTSKRDALTKSINSKLLTLFKEFIKELSKSAFSEFTQSLNDKSTKATFLERSTDAKTIALTSFSQELEPVNELDPETFTYQNELEEFSSKLQEQIQRSREQEINTLTSRIAKKLVPSLKNETVDSFAAPDIEMWDRVLDSFRELLKLSLSKYQTSDSTYDFKLGCSPEENDRIVQKIGKESWLSFDNFIHDYLRPDNVVNILKRQFDEVFTYDNTGIPRVWKNETEISSAYREASQHALKSLPLLSIAKLSNDSEIIPDYDIYDDEDEEDVHPHRFSHILSAPEQLRVKKDFLKQAEVSYRDASRSIISNISKIPPFMYILLIVLGWNEFMAILRNPLYLVLAILIGTGLFFVNTLNLWGPLDLAFHALVKQIKAHLASILLDDNSATVPQPLESYEMDDLSEKIE
ncbi:dynamin-like GTPase SEY1 [Cyberlindnera jadinii NRRL Y-1542]|uniref:Root hair defective 3 GTP-binding protein n=1 Tax=Cyberlindnera jadinii (strain ATCC 18201 / CBS 1600 / BCRC 20928 / JCM 3617 / NBRC 0987 / NRRL Y-1542) TaxID=983966 RepID=A0A1E4S251_CYBJN|nr:root hair defective 3 GTP-binding protein [Cyberlindnera jadinii NRRL Y-1542]ODV73568.1 root hair defective 3 GTP-binding protein [Cyberlindnera jadinii NRRL Y-1542]